MLENPWIRYTPEDATPNAGAVPQELVDWLTGRFGERPEQGWGYSTWVFVGSRAVIKVDPAPGRPTRFSHEQAASDLAGCWPSIPRVIEQGTWRGHAWVEIQRMPGVPAYLRWPRMSRAAKARFLSQLAEVVGMLQTLRPDADLMHAPDEPWRAYASRVFTKNLSRARAWMPPDYADASREAFESRAPHLEGERDALCHGDLWFGNLLMSERGDLTAMLDFDRLAVAPADYELDMFLRFWQYPASFVPEEWEAVYRAPLEFALAQPVVEVCRGGLSDDEIRARLSLLELAYRLGLVARFGWGAEMRSMFDRVLEGRWAREALGM